MSLVPQSATSVLPAPAAGATRLSIRSMVCPRCLRVVQRGLEKAGLVVDAVSLSAANVRTPTGEPMAVPLVQNTLRGVAKQTGENLRVGRAVACNSPLTPC